MWPSATNFSREPSWAPSVSAIFDKSKMADGRHLEKSKTAISLQRFDRSAQNLAVYNAFWLSEWYGQLKFSTFKYPKWRTAASWKTEQELIRSWDSERELFTTISHTYFKIPKRVPTSFDKLDEYCALSLEFMNLLQNFHLTVIEYLYRGRRAVPLQTFTTRHSNRKLSIVIALSTTFT